MIKIVTIAGARPNFIKIAPLMWEMRKHPEIHSFLIHTGQHYDVRMAGQFFQDLNIPTPDISLEVGSGTHAYQTAEVMRKLEPILTEIHPDVIVVVGDVNSTVAAALTAAKLQIPVAHVEAGLRSFDRTMPEEINRIVTDAVSDYLFVSEESGVENLRREGALEERIYFVGNVMIDSLEASRKAWARSSIRQQLGLEKQGYGIVTLHRPANVDDPVILRGLVEALTEVAKRLPLLFPIHPRTRNRVKEFGLQEYFCELSFDSKLNTRYSFRSPTLYTLNPEISTQHPNLYCTEPLGYLDFMSLVAEARLVLTDSGGLQEETTVLGVPCLTLRENTERPATVSSGTNRIVGTNSRSIVAEAFRVYAQPRSHVPCPPLWDGNASRRIVNILRQKLSGDRCDLALARSIA